MKPSFAAVIPAHNGMPDVLDAVRSALDQTHPPAEILVVDDRSTDGTGQQITRRFGDRVRVLDGSFGSAAAARNAGWRATSAPWVALLDADDLWFPSKLETMAGLLEAEPRARWGFSDGAFRDLDGTVHASWFTTYAELPEPYVGQPVAALIEVNFMLTSSIVIERSALAATGGFDESLSHAEDVDLWIRLARRWPAVGSTRSLVRYQHRPGGLTRQVEARLGGSARVFDRLALDPLLPTELRRRARHRAAVARFKLALAALREGRQEAARRCLAGAWLFPERAVATTALWLATLLPPAVRNRLAQQQWTRRNVSAPAGATRRVTVGGVIAPEARS